MGFGNSEDWRKAKDRLGKERSGLVVEDVKNRNQLFVLKGVLAANIDGDIVKALRNQNRDVFDGLGLGDDHRGPRSPVLVTHPLREDNRRGICPRQPY
ncbi:unnamed protein product [Euphydryas editha]|uniref:Uncharacterized protein n=1 Tax=Euphydryas editha TaxID=104508 RepID=A0AAU9U544_EUPED|nr:unnamed protein product [Euphydryas editha]